MFSIALIIDDFPCLREHGLIPQKNTLMTFGHSANFDRFIVESDLRNSHDPRLFSEEQIKHSTKTILAQRYEKKAIQTKKVTIAFFLVLLNQGLKKATNWNHHSGAQFVNFTLPYDILSRIAVYFSFENDIMAALSHRQTTAIQGKSITLFRPMSREKEGDDEHPLAISIR